MKDNKIKSVREMQLEKSQLTVTGFEYVGRGPQIKEYGSIQQMQKKKKKPSVLQTAREQGP